MVENITFRLRGDEDFIPLISLLKATNVVETGSEAQSAVLMGEVLRNGVVELRKRAKIRSGETIEWNNYKILVI
ncbi:MAG: RNA-binding S4 domain-containing protein [Paludibacteraceae bacterium]|nr:RNA-binding S4 domain-containing protein [Paludibacteraceae bacterium]